MAGLGIIVGSGVEGEGKIISGVGTGRGTIVCMGTLVIFGVATGGGVLLVLGVLIGIGAIVI
ncbi:MAG: hypothetical protein V2A78_00295 [bacterium]